MSAVSGAFSDGNACASVRTLEEDFIEEAEEEDEPRPSRRGRNDVDEQDDDDDEEDEEGRFLFTISPLCLLARAIWVVELFLLLQWDVFMCYAELFFLPVSLFLLLLCVLLFVWN